MQKKNCRKNACLKIAAQKREKRRKKIIGETKVSPSQARCVKISRKMLTGAAESIL